MGDGGVACVPSQHVMERFSESSYCGGNGGLHSNSKSLQLVVERKMEIEQGEICPEKGRKDELLASSSSREEVLATRVEVRIASSVRFPDEDGGSRDRNESRKRYSRWDVSHERERESKSNSSRNADDEFGSYSKHRYGEGQNHGKDYGKSGNRLKRHSNESETSSSRRYYGDHSDRDSSRGGGGASRSRRVCEDSRSSYLDKSRGRSSAERGYRNSSSSRISSSSNKYSSRPYELSSSRGARDRHGRSPGYSDRSPIDRGRIRSPIYYDRSPVDRGRGRSPVYLDRSPVDRGRARSPLYSNRSPVDRGRGRSPVYSDRSPVDRGRGRSPLYSNRSPVDRGRGRSPVYSDRSPVDRGRGRSPAYLDSSPVDRGRGRSPAYLDRSPIDRGRYRDHRDGNRKSGGSDRYHSRTGNQGHEERLGRKDSGGKDSHRLSSSRQSNNNSTRNEKNAEDQAQKEKYPQTSNGNCEKPSQVDGALEEMPSMEEDMDICDSPPYVVPDQLEKTNSVSMRGWFFLDHLGTEQGPSNLCDLKKLVEDGFLLSDHLIKHSESDRWVTVENAASPLVPRNTPSIVSDTVTQLVNPPEAPGNLLVDAGDPGQSESHHSRELSVSSSLGVLQPTENSVTSESPSHLEDLHITERVEALLKGFTLVPGRELETIAEALETTLEHSEWEKGPNYEGFLRFKDGSGEFSRHQREEEFGRGFEAMTKESPSQWSGARSSAPVGKDRAYPKCDSSHWFAGRWSCKGGDWKRNDEATAYDRLAKRKLVLNDGYPLCQMPKSGFADPRGHKKDDLHHYLHFKRLEVPSWAYCWQEEKTDSSYQTDVFSEAPSSASNVVGSTSHGMNDQTKFVKAINGDVTKNVVAGRLSQNKQLVPRVLKGSLQPVVKNNASMVVKNQGSFFRDLRARVRGNEWHNSRSNQASFLGNGKGPFVQDVSQSKTQEKSENSPTGHIRRVDDLKLHLGDWFFLDGAGHEHGPSSFFELQALVAKGIIQKNTSIFRKTDNIWVPVAAAEMAGEVVDREILPEVQGSGLPNSSDASLPQSQDACCDTKLASGSFHDLYPQFIGYTRGRLHELVMKSYKSREFAAAINEVLDPWISAKQPKKAVDRHFPVNSSSWLSSISRSSAVLAHDLSHKLQKSDFEANNMEDDDAQEDFLADQKNDDSFEELCREVGFREETNTGPELVGTENWGLLNDRILARVFYYLRTDLKCLAFSAATCKSWYAAAKFYKSVCRQVDFSSSGPACTDTKFRNILSGYDKSMIKAFVLTGCTNVSAAALEEVLQSFTAIISIDIRGCSQFRELTSTYQNIRWRRKHYLRLSNGNRTPEESHYKIRSLKQTSDRIYTSSKASKGSGSHFDDSSEEKDLANHAFQQGCYKRRKLARKSSALLSRDAHMMRGWLRRKSSLLSALDYQKLEPYLASTLKDIMRENTFKFFIPKVEEIEGRMRNRYYIHRGLSAVKDDISRMCRDAMKANTRGDAGDMSRIIMLFMKLVTSLEESSKSSHERDEMVKSLKDGSVSGYSSMNSRYKKKDLAGLSERRGMNRRNINGIDVGDYASDREFRKRLSKLNKTSMDSENETSDDTDLSEVDVRRDSEDTDSDMDVGLNFRFEGESVDFKGEIYLGEDDASMSEDREWGARMTKAGLVPPVTRKYEVIDRYVVVADEEMVHRKMHVALPDDYAEKLRAQKNGAEESDMEIPEVKDYKPRKQLEDEVLEQEVYGIDPYTHNLLLDSMPEELDWPLPEKHLFIEEVLLRALNRQVRCYTGNGSAPMEYPLRPVIREIQEDAEKTGDMRITKMCQEILKAIDSRRDDNYVAYRKGLGVVCNKEGGFGDDDFVVEFLGEVYPAWKWFEKQDGIRSLQKNNKDPAPEFYNIYLERPKGDRDGYDLVVVDAMHKANYASRICHSCRPNCEAKVTAVDGQYQIGIYTVRPIGFGEEITFDYNSVTESKEEYEASVCLCGSQVCRGSYLNLTGEGAFQKVLKECHGMLDRHQLMLEAFDANFVSQEDYTDLGRAGLGTCLLSGLPDWLIAYSARLVRFINFERTKLPEEILKHNLEEKKKFFAEICLEVEKSDAEIQAEGVYNQRLQNLALTLDKVRYVMRCVFGDPKRAPPPLEKVSSEALVPFLWKGEGSLVEELLRCMAPHVESELLNDLKSKIHVHDLSDSGDPRRELRKSLLWLRDELRNLPSTYKCRHDAAADLIHMYAYTKCFFRVRDYKTVTSEPVYISPLDLGPKYADKLGSGFQEYRKTYGEGYCLGQLIYWHNQADAEPDLSLARARRGCLALPDISSFYAKSQKPSKKRVYGPRTVKSILSRMEKQPQRPWPKDEIWSFKNPPRIFGSPMLDAVMNKSALDKEMMQWLKTRSVVFQAPWDQ